MDDDMKQLRVKFSGVGHEDQVGRGTTMAIPSQRSTGFGRGLVNHGKEYDAAYAATVAAVAYAIAKREDKLLASGNKERLGSQKKRVSFDEGSKISRWFSGKESLDDDYDDEQGGNVSIKRPLKPAPKKRPAENVIENPISLKKDHPSLVRKPTERNGSKRFEQVVPPPAPPAKPMSGSSYSGRGSRVAASEMATPSEAETMADAWEKEKMAKIKRQYNETMDTITEWEAEKKAKARRQKQLKDESDSERKRAKALEEYNDDMSRINKVAAASRLTAEDKRRNAETKVREKADKIRSTGKLPSTCPCF